MLQDFPKSRKGHPAQARVVRESDETHIDLPVWLPVRIQESHSEVIFHGVGVGRVAAEVGEMLTLEGSYDDLALELVDLVEEQDDVSLGEQARVADAVEESHVVEDMRHQWILPETFVVQGDIHGEDDYVGIVEELKIEFQSASHTADVIDAVEKALHESRCGVVRQENISIGWQVVRFVKITNPIS